MCSAKKPSIPKTTQQQQPLVVQSPEVEAEVSVGGDSEEKKDRRRKAAKGTGQLTIPTNSGVGTAGKSGVGAV